MDPWDNYIFILVSLEPEELDQRLAMRRVVDTFQQSNDILN